MATATRHLTSKISFYKNTFDVSNDVETTIDTFLQDVLSGKYQDQVFVVRAEKDKDKRSKIKKKTLPCVAISGSFSKREDSALRAHSGFMAIDIDNINENIDAVKNILIQDPYVYAAFVSASGNGLCLIIQIDGDRHDDAFSGISKYLYDNYQVIVDSSGRNISRLRYASYDPFLYSSGSPLVFKKYLPKEKPKPQNRIVFVKTEFDHIIKEMADRSINLCEDYREWVGVGYALASEFGASGEDYFHTLSSQSSKYNEKNCSDLYKSILKTEDSTKAKKSSIGRIYYFAKLNNIATYSTETQEIIKSTTTLKKSGLSAAAIAKNLQEFNDIPVSESLDIITQAIQNNVEIEEGDGIVEQCERWLQYNTKLRRNEISRMIEDDGVPLDTYGFNTLFIAAKKVIEKLDYTLFERIILSNNTPNFNPLIEWFKSYDGRNPEGNIAKLAATIETPNPEYAEAFIRKWLVGMIASIYGSHSPLMLILAGEKQNTGKTQWFRRLLPSDLNKKYFANSKLDKGKDDEILMTQNIMILDDEMAGKSKKEATMMKNITSADYFSLREPYGRSNVKLRRLAVLCGSTNTLGILNDPTGNRRFLPIQVISINHEAYNKIDKVDLIMEAHKLYKENYQWELTSDDIKYLNSNTEQFEIYNSEYELIQAFLTLPDDDTQEFQITYMIAVEIKAYLELKSNQKIGSKASLIAELSKIGFMKKSKKINGYSTDRYAVIKNETAPFIPDTYPF
jgi:predicted P-loop ATPase